MRRRHRSRQPESCREVAFMGCLFVTLTMGLTVVICAALQWIFG